MFREIASAMRRFVHDTRGGATAFAAAGVVVMTVAGAALIVDHVHLIDQRDLLQSAADAASMAATRELGELPSSMPETDVRERLLPVARKYATFNVLQNVKDPDLTADDIAVALDIDRRAKTVSATVSADIGKTLMADWLLGYSGPGTVARESGVETIQTPLEVVLAIDVSTSMGMSLDGRWGVPSRDSRMAVIRSAVATLVDILEPGEANRVALGIVPWHGVVRLAEVARNSWVSNGWAEYPQSRHYAAPYLCTTGADCEITGVDQTLPAAPEEEWLGCLDEHRVGAEGHASLPAQLENLFVLPSETPFAQSVFPSEAGLAYQCLSPPLPSDFDLQRCNDRASASRAQSAAGRNGRVFLRSADWMCDNNMMPVLPLTPNRAAIDTAVDDLAPVGQGTYSATGILWGQRLLSPSWKTVWGGSAYPADADDDGNAGARRAMVLLTDGEDVQCGRSDPECEINGAGVARADACSAAKAAGTEIFVVAAMHPSQVSRGLGTALHACSSQRDKPDGSYVFLNNEDPDDLRSAFVTIARQLRTFRRIY